MKHDELQTHMFATYANLRLGVAFIGIIFPLVLWGGGAGLDIQFQESMSAYYHASENGQSMRNWYVGILFAIGVLLFLYRGYNHRENRALNLAGAFAVGIAIFPSEWGCGGECENITLHGICAAAFFLSIAYVSLRCASDTLHLMEDEVREKRFRLLYRLMGIGMILFPSIILLMTQVLDQFQSLIFFAEALGIWIFASYWLLKSWEIYLTNSERLALRNMLFAK